MVQTTILFIRDLLNKKPSKEARLKSKLGKIFAKILFRRSRGSLPSSDRITYRFILTSHIFKLNIKSKDKIFLYELAKDF